jgi:hypothetical protein
MKEKVARGKAEVAGGQDHMGDFGGYCKSY